MCPDKNMEPETDGPAKKSCEEIPSLEINRGTNNESRDPVKKTRGPRGSRNPDVTIQPAAGAEPTNK